MSITPGTIKIKASAAYAVGLLLLFYIAVKIFGNPEYLVLMRHVSFSQVIISLLIGFFLFLINGYILAYLVKQHYWTTIKCIDMVVLPFMMHLFSYIIPFRGGLLFSALFLKIKYNIRVTEGIAIGVFTLIISLIITGLCGIYFAVSNGMLCSVWSFLSILFILSPLVVVILGRFVRDIELKPGSVPDKIKTIICSISSSSQRLLTDYRRSLVIFFLTIASNIGYVIFLYFIAFILQMNTTIDRIIMFALMMRLSTIVRLAPGNLGVQEFFSGGAYYMLGGSLNDGLAMALFVRFISLMLTFFIGIGGLLMNMNRIRFQEIKRLWKETAQYSNL